MKRALALGLGGVAAWLLYNSLGAPDEAAASGGAGAPSPAPAPPQAVDDFRAAVVRGLRADGEAEVPARLTWDQWNYYLERGSGRPGRPLEEARPLGERSDLLTLDEWRASSAGLGWLAGVLGA